MKEGKLEGTHSLFLGSRGGGGNEGKPGVGVADDSSVVRVAGVAEVVDASVAEVVDGVGVGGVVEAGVGHDGSSGDDGGGNRCSDKRSGLGHNVDGSRGLLGGKTTGGGVIESSLESGLGGGNILNIVQVGSSDLSSLHVVVDRVEGVGPQGGVLAGLGGGEGGVEHLLGSGHLGGVLKGGGGGQRQERAKSLKNAVFSVKISFGLFSQVSYQLVHVECCSGESSE